MIFSFVKENRSHAAPIYSLCEHNNGFLTGGADKIATLWNTDLENQPLQIKTDFGIYHLNYNNNLLYIGQSKGSCHIIDLKQKKEVALLHAHKNGVYKSIITNERIFLLGGDGKMSVWDKHTNKHIKTLTIGEGKLRDAVIINDEIFIAGSYGKITSVGTTELTITKSYYCGEDHLYTLLPHPEKKHMIFCAGKDANLYVLNTKKEESIQFPAHNFGIYKICHLAPNNVIASCSRDKSIKLWDCNSLDFINKVERTGANGHTGSINNILWNKPEQQLISVGDDKRIISWQATT